MESPRALYIDGEGITRGYYVYVHKDPETGAVFYVGKGHGRRAWQRTGRHQLWLGKTRDLKGLWDVGLVHTDLSEIEAFELEARLVKEHGGPASCGGKLTNWLPGGEDPIAMIVGLPKEWSDFIQAYDDEREFKELPRDHQEGVALQLKQHLDPVVETLEELAEKAEDDFDEALEDSITDFESIIGSTLSQANELLRRRISWKDVCLSLEEMVDDLEPTDINSLHEDLQPLAKGCKKCAQELFRLVDSDT